MNSEQKAQQQITTVGGSRCIIKCAGTIAGVKYFECRCPRTNKMLGYVGQVSENKYGPLCKEAFDATMRARIIAENGMTFWDVLLNFQFQR